MITGIHVLIYSRDANADCAFFRDVLGLHSVDAGDGWLHFAAPASEVACHPGETNSKHERYLMCDDVRAEIARLDEKRNQVYFSHRCRLGPIDHDRSARRR